VLGQLTGSIQRNTIHNSQVPILFPSLCSKKQNQTMNKYNATITQINTKIFTWKTRCGKNHGTGVHLKTSTITNNGFTIVLPQIQLRATTYISSRTTYSRITTRLKKNYLRKTHNTDSPVFCQNGQLPHHQSSIQPFRMKRNVSRSCCQNLSPIQR
jgi:hypothetical protein